MTNNELEIIANNKLQISFNKTTGKLVSIRNLQTGNEYLNAANDCGSPFAVYYDFAQDYELHAEPRASK